MRQATEALARNASYRPRSRHADPSGSRSSRSSTPPGAPAATNTPSRTYSRNAISNGASPPGPASGQRAANGSSSRGVSPRATAASSGRAGDLDTGSQAVTRSASSQQSAEQAEAQERGRVILEQNAARITDLQLAQQQAQARKLAEAQASASRRYVMSPGQVSVGPRNIAGVQLGPQPGAPQAGGAPVDAVARVVMPGKVSDTPGAVNPSVSSPPVALTGVTPSV
jgi:hypothetical protein